MSQIVALFFFFVFFPTRTFSVSFVQLLLSVTFDYAPQDISWNLTDSAGVVYDEAVIGTYANELSATVPINVPSGNLTFSIHDAHGDGMMGSNAGYKIVLASNLSHVVLQGDGKFGPGRSQTFFVPPGSAGVVYDNGGSAAPLVPESPMATSAPTLAGSTNPSNAPSVLSFPSRSPVLLPNQICKRWGSKCDSDADCCSNRCAQGVCRSSFGTITAGKDPLSVNAGMGGAAGATATQNHNN